MSKRFMSLEDFMSRLTYGPTDSRYVKEGDSVRDEYEVLQGSRLTIYFTSEDGKEVEVEHIEQEGGGEGGGEYCYTVLKLGNNFYKVEYNYYSHQGYDTDCAALYEVTPKQQTITVYE